MDQKFRELALDLKENMTITVKKIAVKTFKESITLCHKLISNHEKRINILETQTLQKELPGTYLWPEKTKTTMNLSMKELKRILCPSNHSQ